MDGSVVFVRLATRSEYDWIRGPTWVYNPNGKSIGSAERPWTLQWAPIFRKSCLFPWWSGPSSNLWFIGPIWAHNPNGISIGSAVFAQMTADLDPHLIHGFLSPPESSIQTAPHSVQLFLQGSLVWQTDRPRYSVRNNRPHLADAVMRPNNKNSNNNCGLHTVVWLKFNGTFNTN